MALVPTGVVTVMSTVPVPAGEVTVSWVAEMNENGGRDGPEVDGAGPGEAGPVTATGAAGGIADHGGDGADGRGRLVGEPVGAGGVLVPTGVVTVTSTVAVPAGEVTVMAPAETTVKLAAATEPKLTALAPVKPEPVMVTVLPPAGRPATGATA